MIYTILIPNWHPHALNKLLGVHWGTANRMKSGDMQMIAAYATQSKIPKATGKRMVAMTITLGKGQRACDPDAYYKSPLDALVNLGYLKDDNRQWLQLQPITFDRASLPATTIVISEVER